MVTGSCPDASSAQNVYSLAHKRRDVDYGKDGLGITGRRINVYLLHADPLAREVVVTGLDRTPDVTPENIECLCHYCDVAHSRRIEKLTTRRGCGLLVGGHLQMSPVAPVAQPSAMEREPRLRAWPGLFAFQYYPLLPAMT